MSGKTKKNTQHPVFGVRLPLELRAQLTADAKEHMRPVGTHLSWILRQYFRSRALELRLPVSAPAVPASADPPEAPASLGPLGAEPTIEELWAAELIAARAGWSLRRLEQRSAPDRCAYCFAQISYSVIGKRGFCRVCRKMAGVAPYAPKTCSARGLMQKCPGSDCPFQRHKDAEVCDVCIDLSLGYYKKPVPSRPPPPHVLAAAEKLEGKR